MALQIRRGLEADRSSITPLAGELLYVTDTKNIYVGDGTTAGGTLVTGDVADDTTPQLGGDLDLNGNDITGTGNINITGNIIASGNITAGGNIDIGDAPGDTLTILAQVDSSITPETDSSYNIGAADRRWNQGYFTGLTVDGQIDGVSFNGDVIADDSTISFNASTGAFTGNLTGNLNGNAVGNHSGTFDGDVTGSVFSDDSTLIIDAVNKNIVAENLNIGVAAVSRRIKTPEDTLTIEKEDLSSGNLNSRLTSRDGTSTLFLSRNTDSDISSDNAPQYGSILFERNDAGGPLVTSIIYGSRNALLFGNDPSGAFSGEDGLLVWTESKLGVGKNYPTEVLDVAGNAIFDGTVDAASFRGSLVADDSTVIVDAINGTITASGFVQFGSYSDADLSSFTPENGMVYYNTTDNRFRGYQNGGWINLDDGTAA